MSRRSLAVLVFLMGLSCGSILITAQSASPNLSTNFHWKTKSPILEPRPTDGETWHSVKDPSIVRHEGRWHLFCTVRGKTRTHAIAYLSFGDWLEAESAKRFILPCHTGYFCAPQVFFFTPHQKWYLICQASDPGWNPKYQPAFTQTDHLDSPQSWTALRPLFPSKNPEISAWLDFWIICDAEKAHLFYTSLNGKMWRMETAIDKFPYGWSKASLALQGDIFEASHTYQLRGRSEYLTFVEAQNGHGWRYFKAYLAESLAGPWRPIAAEKDTAFASMRNVRQNEARWTDVVSHGEILRSGVDEHMEIDPSCLRMVIQGVLDKDREGKGYGDIPWKLGLLEQEQTP